MNNQDIPLFEEKIHRATRLPEPRPEAADEIWAKIAEFENKKINNLSEPEPGFLTGLQALFSQKLFNLRRLQTGMVFMLAILLTGIFLFSTPVGRTWAQSVVRFFTRATSNIIPAPTQIPLVWVEQTPGVPAATATPLPGPAFSDECGDYSNPKCNVEQIRSKVNFTIKELSVIPAPLYFVGTTGGPDGVIITYGTQDHSAGLILDEQPWTGSTDQTQWEIGPDAVVDTVTIGTGTGEYVKGSFGYKAGETQAKWDPNADIQVLHWVDNDIFFQMENVGTQLERDKFIALASSLTGEPVSAKITPVPSAITPTNEAFDFSKMYPLTVAEAEEKAGFKLILPSKLPDILSFLGASIKPEQKIVSIFYSFNPDMGPNTDGVTLAEEPIPTNGSAYDLSSFLVGDKTEIDKHAPGIIVGAIEKVQIGEITGQYVEGTWSGTDCCGWKWEADPYLKRLRWQKKGMAFELMYMGMAITKEDLVTIAKGMK
jgi:hypothetical protein